MTIDAPPYTISSSVTLIDKAAVFARLAHQGQVRKYTGDPYFVHCEAVAQRVARFTGDHQVIQAAYLHDVVEDTSVTEKELRLFFSDWTVNMVMDLTDQEKGNRKMRKALAAQRLANASYEVQLIKLCDLIDNTHSIVEHDPNFAKVYLAEKRALLAGMTKVADTLLYREAVALADPVPEYPFDGV